MDTMDLKSANKAAVIAYGELLMRVFNIAYVFHYVEHDDVLQDPIMNNNPANAQLFEADAWLTKSVLAFLPQLAQLVEAVAYLTGQPANQSPSTVNDAKIWFEGVFKPFTQS